MEMRAADLVSAPSFSPSLPVIPDFYPRYSRESGNQARHSKSSMNRERQIPSPFMGEG